ncbi:homoserine dehydrogenase [Tumebacillus permanentifrigoris]|uniref:Homoserine dehydrogenase n=1 Tax=Tumebacillus permanentifrigoris TaxID=378543 RepID=A0A316D9P9_9BACL|nr:homoserine dehydrogenase [Tumebacillus permanentifrigoris]PWK08458.1 homoserine dehydrogenase [Tumebacillus permanentifrigoris]
MNRKVVKVGLLGLGTVGSGVVKMLRQNVEELAQKCGYEVEIQRVLVRDLEKMRAVDVERHMLTRDVQDILEDPEVRIVIEVMGGEEQTKEIVLQALQAGKHVITANKDLVALHGALLHRAADENGVELLYEAAVAGAIPIVRVLKQSFAADNVREVMGIVNGTTNYILSKMTAEGAAYEDALAEAQQLGYAEADPHADVSGLDAARKMAILASISFRQAVELADVKLEGIESVTQQDVERAKAGGQVIKLIGRARREGSAIEVSVAPMWLEAAHPLAKVGDCFNAVYVYADALGEAMLYGRGAGEMPTASAVVGDLLAVLRGRKFAAAQPQQMARWA